MRKTIYILCLLFLYVNVSLSQSIEELYSELNEAASQTIEIQVMNKLSLAYLRMNLDSSEHYAEKALSESKIQNYAEGEAQSLWLLGKISVYKGMFDNAIEKFANSKNVYVSIQDDNGIAKTMDEIGYCLMIKEQFDSSETVLDSAYNFAEASGDSSLMIRIKLNLQGLEMYRGSFDKSLALLFEAYDLALKTNNTRYRINSLLNFGNLYSIRDELDKSLEYFEKAAELIERSRGKPSQLHYCYNSMGSIYIKKANHSKALKYGLKAYELNDRVHIKPAVMETNNVLAQAYLGLNEFEKAISYAQAALSIAEEVNIPTMIALCNFNLGQAYSYSGQRTISLSYLQKSLERFEELDSQFQLAQNLNVLAETYEALGNYKQAFEFQRRHDILQDSLYDERNQKILTELETEYKVKEQEAALGLQAAELSEQKTINYATAIVAVLFLVIAVLAYSEVRRRKHLNKKLKSLDETKSRFFSNISHEMRNPLTLIMAPLQNLSERTADSPYNAELKLAYSNSKKLLERVNEILDLSKLESGKMDLHKVPVSLFHLTKRILYSYQSIAQYRKIEITFDYKPDNTLTVLIDVEKFEKILNNLILNAFKFSLTGGTVLLSVTSENEMFHFSVKDSGKGIHLDDLPNIFNRYYQSAQKDSTETGGTGLGLTLANEYAKLLGGGISVESKPGQGSNFILSIPLEITDSKVILKEDEIPQTSPAADDKFPTVLIDGQKPKLLIVEDDLEMSRYLDEILSKDYSCIAAPDGKEGLEILNEQKVDIIISDIMMPNMDGFEFREKVRMNKEWIKIPFVMLTARTLAEDKIHGFKLGVDDYITKPFNSKELFARVNNLIINKLERNKFLDENPQESESDNQISAEEELLKTANNFVLENIDDTEFTVDKLAEHMSYSIRQLERLLKRHSGFTPNAFIREIRLQRAHQILQQRKFTTVKEVCYEVGMNNPAYFSSKFKERFGTSPTDVINESKYVELV